MPSLPNTNTGNSDYINTTDYKKLGNKLHELKGILESASERTVASRKLRYAELDIEMEREAGRIGPDELYIPVHTIDTNIRREQSSYIQYLTQSPRAVILEDTQDSTIDLSVLERDLTAKIRYNGWQLPMFANIDSFQAFGFGVVELVQDLSNPGELAIEQVQQSDFGFVSDTRDLQSCEMLGRTYHYTKTKLLSLCGDPQKPNPGVDWNKEQVEKVVAKDSQASTSEYDESIDSRDRSLYRIQKIMFRVNGIVNVGWACIEVCDDWLRAPRPLYIGRRQIQQENPIIAKVKQLTGAPPASTEQYETQYPYYLFQYLISENDTISHLKGRIFLDQDVQEGVSSLLSSTCTQARRAAGMYFSKDTEDPNDDVLLQKNVFLKQGCLINKKINAFKIDPPDPGIFSAIQLLVSGNMQETSQVSFAESNNQRDSRKTAAAIKEAAKQQQILTTVQVVLFSLALRNLYQTMCAVIKSRVQAGLIQVTQQVRPLYDRNWLVKPSGDVDVIEKQQRIQAMQNAWPVVQNTPANVSFMCDLLSLMFPENAAKYIQLIQQSQQQQQSQQAQMQQQIMQFAMQLGQGIVELSKHVDWFSDIGKLHAYPIVEQAAQKVQALEQQLMPKQQGARHDIQH